MRKRTFSNTGNRISALKSNWNLPNIYLLILSTMAHLLPQEHPIMDTLLQAPSRTSSVDTLPKPVITFLEDSVGTVTDFPLNMRLINNSKSQTSDKSWKWVLPSTIKNVETLS